MNKFKNLIFIVLLIFLFVEILIIFPAKLEIEDDKTLRARLAEQQKKIKTSHNKPGEISRLSDQVMGGVHLVESQQGSRDWELFANSAEGSKASGAWTLHQVKVLFYHKDKVEFTVTGDEGSIDAKSKDLSIVGNVSTLSDNGYHFKTHSIHYLSNKRQIQCPTEVEMKGPADSAGGGIFVKGRNMLVKVDESKMFIQENVTARKPMKKGVDFFVTAEGVEFSGKNREAKFRGRVFINYEGMQIEGPEASFLYGNNNDALSSVDLIGGVKVKGQDKQATSQNLSLDLITNKFIFRGSPRVVQNEDELSGEEIIFLDGGKKVKIEKARIKMENPKE